MEYLVYLVNVGMQVFLCFQDDEEVEITKLPTINFSYFYEFLGVAYGL
jgi:hypothetical protein